VKEKDGEKKTCPEKKKKEFGALKDPKKGQKGPEWFLPSPIEVQLTLDIFFP